MNRREEILAQVSTIVAIPSCVEKAVALLNKKARIDIVRGLT